MEIRKPRASRSRLLLSLATTAACTSVTSRTQVPASRSSRTGRRRPDDRAHRAHAGKPGHLREPESQLVEDLLYELPCASSRHSKATPHHRTVGVADYLSRHRHFARRAVIGCECGTCRSADPRNPPHPPFRVHRTDAGARFSSTRGRPAIASAGVRISPWDAILFPTVTPITSSRRRAPVQPHHASADGLLRRRVDRRRHPPHVRVRVRSHAPREAVCRSWSSSRWRSFCLGRQEVIPIPVRHGGGPHGLRLGGSVPDDCARFRTVVASGGSRFARARRSSRAASPHALSLGEAIEAPTEPVPAYILHAHVPRPAARRDVCGLPPAWSCYDGLRCVPIMNVAHFPDDAVVKCISRCSPWEFDGRIAGT